MCNNQVVPVGLPGKPIKLSRRVKAARTHLQPLQGVHRSGGVGWRAQDEQAALGRERGSQLIRCHQVALLCGAVYDLWHSPCQARHLRVTHPERRWNQNLHEHPHVRDLIVATMLVSRYQRDHNSHNGRFMVKSEVPKMRSEDLEQLFVLSPDSFAHLISR